MFYRLLSKNLTAKKIKVSKLKIHNGKTISSVIFLICSYPTCQLLLVTSRGACLSRRILARQITQRSGKSLWLTAIWMVFTKHRRHTTRCPHGDVCIVAFAFTHITHWNLLFQSYKIVSLH